MSLNRQWRTDAIGWSRDIGSTLGSIRLAIPLVVALTIALAWAATLSNRHSAAHARWYVYETRWFFSLLGLLAINRVCDAVLRLTTWRQHIGFLIAHSGLLTFLIGVLWSLTCGATGYIALAAGQSTDHAIDSDRSQITAFWVGQPQEQSFEFSFNPGPVNWPDRKILDLGSVDGIHARLMAYIPRPRPLETWVPDKSGRAGPLVKFKLLGPDGKSAGEGWLSDQQFGDAVAIGPIRLQLERAISDGMVDDFLQPRLDDVGEKGLLLMYHGDVSQRVSVDQALGNRIALGTTGVAVEIAEYLPNAVPDRLGKFTSKGEHAKNPMLELVVHVPDQNEPHRQIAFAKDPFLNLDGVYSTVCPVTFRFYHPGVKRQTGVELIQDSRGRLLARLHESGTYTSRGEIHAGEKLSVSGNFQLEVTEYLPHATSQLSFVHDDLNLSAKDQSRMEPAALVEITTENTTKQVWLRRNDGTYGQSAIALPGGKMALRFESAKLPFGFSLALVDSKQEARSAISSNVRIVDAEHGIDQEKSITKKQPLMHRGLIIYPSVSEPSPHGNGSATFVVTDDPARAMKHLGGLVFLLGVATSCLSRYLYSTV